jgi:large subunit ribosomal protein L4
MEATIYNQSGKSAGTLTLSEAVFGLPWNADLVHQVVTSMEGTARTPVAHTKNRADVSGGGKKPWKQKGTGRARHGSTRSPIWVGGGVTHGPRNDKDYARKVNKKMKAKALYTILSAKFKKGQILFVDGLNFADSKTKEAKLALTTLATVKGFEDLLSKRKNSAFIATAAKDTSIERSMSNFGNFMVDEIRNMNPLDLMKYKYVVVVNPAAGLEQISSKLK